MGEPFPWSKRGLSFRGQLPAEVVEAIDAVGGQFEPDPDADVVIAALHALGLNFIQCMEGLVAIKDVSLADAKRLVHSHKALADSRDNREELWAALHEEIVRDAC